MKNQLKLLLLHKAKQQQLKIINKCILNKSPSKQLAFFTRAERFPKKKRSISQSKRLSCENRSQSSCSSAKANKFPTIPRAQRTLYFEQQKQLCLNPSPQTYNIRSNEEIFKITHKGDTMGVRFNSVPHIKEVTPSAVDYQKQAISVKKSFNRSFTFDRSQRSLIKVLTKKGMDSPGPKYDIRNNITYQNILPNLQVRGEEKPKRQRNKLNKLKLAALPNNPKQNRFSTLHLEKIDKKASLIEQSQNKGERTLRGHSVKQNTGFSTTQRQRLHTLPQKNPGPGAYVFFSEFSGWA